MKLKREKRSEKISLLQPERGGEESRGPREFGIPRGDQIPSKNVGSKKEKYGKKVYFFFFVHWTLGI